ncbi:MAG: ATP-binding protein [Dehalococcoidia bacterium]
MTSWALRWQILAEAIALTVMVTASTLVWGVPGAVISGLIGIVAALWTGSRLSALLGSVTEGILRIGSVDRHYRLEPEGPAELHRMTRAVNRMSDRLGRLVDIEAGERARLASILDAMQEGVVVVGEDGAVESANAAAMNILGTPASFRAGQLLTSLTRNYEINRIAIECAEMREPRQAQVELYDLRRFVQALATPLAGRVDGEGRALLLINDLTEIRRVDVTRREFFSNASHELRTPIAAVRASAETLQRGAMADPEVAADFLRRIVEDVARMDVMVSEMLELSRLESGQTPLHLAPVDVGRLLRSVADRFHPQANELGVLLRVEFPEDTPMVTADRDKMEHVLTNLVANALKATPRGGSICLGAVPVNDAIRLQVSDTGAGIAPEHLPHIFERFFKANPARNDGGSGLGLAIAKHIVQAHGGGITAESSPGMGATFTVTLPLRR